MNWETVGKKNLGNFTIVHMKGYDRSTSWTLHRFSIFNKGSTKSLFTEDYLSADSSHAKARYQSLDTVGKVKKFLEYHTGSYKVVR